MIFAPNVKRSVRRLRLTADPHTQQRILSDALAVVEGLAQHGACQRYGQLMALVTSYRMAKLTGLAVLIAVVVTGTQYALFLYQLHAG